jgi:hypothetical protein
MSYTGTCDSCGQYIEPGREVIVTDEQGKPKVLCPGCGGSESAVKVDAGPERKLPDREHTGN